jgi:spore germination cell wall hydrolase CwlJ-like protein
MMGMRDLMELNAAVLTLAQEAGGEPRSGKIAVAYVLMVNRPKAFGKSVFDTIFKPSQFSCWNTDSPTRMNLDQVDDGLWAECLRCVLAAKYELEPDPTKGAAFYMNKDVVMASAGKLPSWWDIDCDPASEITIGRHAFRRKR